MVVAHIIQPHIIGRNDGVRSPPRHANTVFHLSGNGNVNDQSGNGLNLSVSTGNARYAPVPGVAGKKGIFFDGETSLIRPGNDAALTITGAMTIEVGLVVDWIASNAYFNIVRFGGAPGSEAAEDNNLYTLYGAPHGSAVANTPGRHQVAYFAETGSGTDVSYAPAESFVPMGVPCVLHMIRESGGNVRFNLNGKAWLDESTGKSAPTGGGDMQLIVGRDDAGSPGQFFRGLMWDLSIITAELSDADTLSRAQFFGCA